MVFLFVEAGFYEWLLGVEGWRGDGDGIKGGKKGNLRCFTFQRMLANVLFWGGQTKC